MITINTGDGYGVSLDFNVDEGSEETLYNYFVEELKKNEDENYLEIPFFAYAHNAGSLLDDWHAKVLKEKFEEKEAGLNVWQSFHPASPLTMFGIVDEKGAEIAAEFLYSIQMYPIYDESGYSDFCYEKFWEAFEVEIADYADRNEWSEEYTEFFKAQVDEFMGLGIMGYDESVFSVIEMVEEDLPKTCKLDRYGIRSCDSIQVILAEYGDVCGNCGRPYWDVEFKTINFKDMDEEVTLSINLNVPVDFSQEELTNYAVDYFEQVYNFNPVEKGLKYIDYHERF